MQTLHRIKQGQPDIHTSTPQITKEQNLPQGRTRNFPFQETHTHPPLILVADRMFMVVNFPLSFTPLSTPQDTPANQQQAPGH